MAEDWCGLMVWLVAGWLLAAGEGGPAAGREVLDSCSVVGLVKGCAAQLQAVDTTGDVGVVGVGDGNVGVGDGDVGVVGVGDGDMDVVGDGDVGVIGNGDVGVMGNGEVGVMGDGDVGVVGVDDGDMGEVGGWRVGGVAGRLRAGEGRSSWEGRVRSPGGPERTSPMRRSLRWVRGTGVGVGVNVGVCGGAWSTRSLTGPPGAISVSNM